MRELWPPARMTTAHGVVQASVPGITHPRWATALLDVCQNLVGPVLEGGGDRDGGDLAEAADGRVDHSAGELLDQGDLFGGAFAPLPALEDLDQLLGAGAARNALAARLVAEEADHVQ